jgi:hypothetical protein
MLRRIVWIVDRMTHAESSGPTTRTPRPAETPRNRIGWTLIALASVACIVGILLQSPGVFPDPGTGILAAEQHRVGRSPSPLVAVTADPRDLAHDRAEHISWWAPSYQMVPYVFRLAGFSWGGAIRTTVLLGWLLGVAGWILYFGHANPDDPWFPWLVLSLVLARFGHGNGHMYDGGEFLLWAVSPYVLLSNLTALGSPRVRVAFGAGLSSGFLFLVKYSALLLCVGLAIAWCWSVWRRTTAPGRLALWIAGVATALLVTRGLGVPGGPTSASLVSSPQWSWAFLWPFTAWVLAATDLDSLLRWVLFHPQRAWLHDERWLALAGVPILMAMGLLARRPCGRAPWDGAAASRTWTMAVALVGAAAGCLVLLPALGSPVYSEARLLRVPALAASPILFGLASKGWRLGAGSTAVWSMAVLCLVYALPTVYGAVTLVDKAAFRTRQTRHLVGLQGLRLDSLGAGGDARAFAGELDALVDARHTVTFFTAPDLALQRAGGRLMVRWVDTQSKEELQREQFRGRPVGGVALLLPTSLEQNGKALLVQRSFVDITTWQRIPLTSTRELVIWRGS